MVSDSSGRLEAHRYSFSPQLCTVRAEPRQLSHMDRGERTHKSKNIQKPQNHDNDHHPIQDRLNRSCPSVCSDLLTRGEHPPRSGSVRVELKALSTSLFPRPVFRAVPGYVLLSEPICGSSSPPR